MNSCLQIWHSWIRLTPRPFQRTQNPPGGGGISNIYNVIVRWAYLISMGRLTHPLSQYMNALPGCPCPLHDLSRKLTQQWFKRRTTFKAVEHVVVAMVTVWFLCCCKVLNMNINVTRTTLIFHLPYSVQNSVSRVSMNINYALQYLLNRSKGAHHSSRRGIRKYCLSCC